MRDQKAREMDIMFNCFPIGKKTIEELSTTHRTIQQNITRFCLMWIKHIATDWTLSTDARNEASVGACKDLWKIEEVREILNRPMPYI